MVVVLQSCEYAKKQMSFMTCELYLNKALQKGEGGAQSNRNILVKLHMRITRLPGNSSQLEKTLENCPPVEGYIGPYLYEQQFTLR